MLLDAGADPNIHDAKYDATVLGWAEFCGQPQVAKLVRERGGTASVAERRSAACAPELFALTRRCPATIAYAGRGAGPQHRPECLRSVTA
jgi:hypothetical protein